MKNQRISLEEFKELFQNEFESETELLKEYESFLSVFEQMDSSIVPELSSSQKAHIFKQSWRQRQEESSWILTWLAFFRRPAVAFALGIAMGCILMSVLMKDYIHLTRTAAAKESLKVEHTRYSRIYKGKIIDDFYSEIENPELVLEKVGETMQLQRTLYGTLDNGEIYVVWNL